MTNQVQFFDSSEIDEFRSANHSWTEIAVFLSTTPKTLRKWRKTNNYHDPFINYSEEEVDEIVNNFTRDRPLVGETVIMAHLLGVHQIHCTRDFLRSSIARVTPDELANRRHLFGRKLVRRVYDIVGPHHLWHIDGWHKLIR